MTTNPYWLPADPQRTHELPTAIKYPLAKRYQDHDGSLGGETILDGSDIPYLEGLRDSGNGDVSTGARLLVEALEKHGAMCHDDVYIC